MDKSYEEAKQFLLDYYYRTLLICPDKKEMDINEYNFIIDDDNIVIEYIQKLDRDYTEYRIMSGFDVLSKDSLLEFEQDKILKKLDIGTVSYIDYYTFACVYVEEIVGDFVEILDMRSLSGTTGLKRLCFPHLKRFHIETFGEKRDYQSLEYCKLGELELLGKDECKNFFDTCLSIKEEQYTTSMIRTRLQYFDTTTPDKLKLLVGRDF